MVLQNSAGAEDVKSQIGSPEGFTLSRNSSVPNSWINISSGRAVVPTNSTFINNRYIAVNTSSSVTKRLEALWSYGDGNGGRFSGTVGPNQTWHVFVLRKRFADTTYVGGEVDFGFGTDPTGVGAPSGWNPRLIGSIMTDGSGYIRPFTQNGDFFHWTTAILDLSTNLTNTVSNMQTLTVPTGVTVDVFGSFTVYSTIGGATLYSGSPSAGSATPYTIVPSAMLTNRVPFRILSNTSGQIRLYGDNNITCDVRTMGFVHPRGAW